MSINLFFQVSGSHRNLVLLLAPGITRALGSNVVLSTACPVFVVLQLVGNELFPRFLDHWLWFELLVREGARARIEVTAGRGKRKR